VCGRPTVSRGLCSADFKGARYEINLGETAEDKARIEQSLIDAGLLLPKNFAKKNGLRSLHQEYLSAKRRRRWPLDGEKQQPKTA
jgi:hypothetical protein